jgi:hypothetical protein
LRDDVRVKHECGAVTVAWHAKVVPTYSGGLLKLFHFSVRVIVESGESHVIYCNGFLLFGYKLFNGLHNEIPSAQ